MALLHVIKDIDAGVELAPFDLLTGHMYGAGNANIDLDAVIAIVLQNIICHRHVSSHCPRPPGNESKPG